MSVFRRFLPIPPATLLLVASLATLVSFGASPAMAQGQDSTKFACQNLKGVPTTVARNKRGQWVPIIQWVSQAFATEGWTPDRRCQEVTSRFNHFYASGQLKYITSGRMNGMPVVCVTPQDNGGCSGQLFTLKSDQNPAATVRKLIAIKNSGGRASVLRETHGRPYVDLEALIEQVLAAQPENQSPQNLQSPETQQGASDSLF